MTSTNPMAALSGLELLQAILDGDAPPPPMALAMNYRLHAVEHGRAVFRGTPSADFHNPMGSLHGGWYGTLLDSALGCAIHSTLPPGRAYTTLEYKVNLTRAIPPGTEVEVVGTIQHSGRTTGVASAEIRGIDDGRLYATGSTTCLIIATG